MTIHIEPCPACESSVEVVPFEDMLFTVACGTTTPKSAGLTWDGCGMRGPLRSSRQSAIWDWNDVALAARVAKFLRGASQVSREGRPIDE